MMLRENAAPRNERAASLAALGWNAFFEQSLASLPEADLSPARVIREEKELYLIHTGQRELPARVTGLFRHQARFPSDFPAVGDWVAIRSLPEQDQQLIHAVLPRKSRFSRKVAWQRTEEQVIAANVDTVFLVSGLDRNFSPRRIERYLVLARESGCRPVVVLSKTDLCPDVDARVAQVTAVAPDVPSCPISAPENTGLEALRPYLLPGTTIALLGSSGVGKSTLVNALLGEERLRVGAVRESDGRGRHITTCRELIQLSSGALLIDNPGMRELQLWGDEEGLDQAFGDIAMLAARCRFRDCRHEQEPGCAVRAAIDDGLLEFGHFQSYIRMKKELSRLALRQKLADHRAEKSRRKECSPRSQARVRAADEWPA